MEEFLLKPEANENKNAFHSSPFIYVLNFFLSQAKTFFINEHSQAPKISAIHLGLVLNEKESLASDEL